MKTYLIICDREYAIEYDYKVISHGCSAHMGSMSYAGHPAEPIEFEISIVDFYQDIPWKEPISLELPAWMKSEIEDWMQSSDDVWAAIDVAEQDDGYYDHLRDDRMTGDM